MKCPICRRKYIKEDIKSYEWHTDELVLNYNEELVPILCTVVFQNNIKFGFPRPHNLFGFTGSRHINLDVCGVFEIHDVWFKT